MGGFGRSKNVALTLIPRQFDTCTISFDLIKVDTWEKYPHNPMTVTTRFTVPLGSLTESTVKYEKEPISVTDDFQIEKTFDTWLVMLTAASRVIFGETHKNYKDTPETESGYTLKLSFYDEAIANRVQEGFNHAADLCRGTEVF